MFGLTKRQFLKRSKKALNETGVQILALRGLMNKEAKGKISLLETQRGLDSLRNNAEETFAQYEKLNPPSECLHLKQKIINALILFYECIVASSESIQAKDDHPEKSHRLLEKSYKKLNNYKELSFSISKDVDSYLKRK